ncbi:MAG: prevent-host-death family protein [Halothiobacillaceae bacterium]|nr:MAG: prevent-host-death family protein [Halothiobacillaceae bacterium]
MKAISYSAVRSNLAKTMEQICDDHEPIVITRKSERSVVMLSLEDYESLEETAYLLRSPKNVKRLVDSISQLESNGGTSRELEENESRFF